MMNFSGNINIDIKEKKYENIQNDINDYTTNYMDSLYQSVENCLIN